MGIVRVMQSMRLVCIDSKIFTLDITPNAFRVYCQILYEAEKYQDEDTYEIDLSVYKLDANDISIAYQELFDLGLLEMQDGVITIVDLAPKPTLTTSRQIQEPTAQTQKDGFIYIIYAVDLQIYKIGCTANVSRRFKQLKHQQIPSDLVLTASYRFENCGKIKDYGFKDCGRIENYLHNLFKEKEVHNEWFKLTQQDLSLIDSKMKLMGGVRDSN